MSRPRPAAVRPPMTPRRPCSGRAPAILLAGLLALTVGPAARAGNPFLTHSISGPVTWTDGVSFFSTDQGPLGILDNETATRMVRDGFATWQAVPTASVTIRDQGPILLDGAPADVTFDNFTRVLFQRDGVSPVVFDHDGRIMSALGLGGFSGFSLVEYLTEDGRHYLEKAIVLNGRDIDDTGPFTPAGWQGLVNHEEGHHLGLGHSVVNAAAHFFGAPILGLPPPPASSLETMYPFLLTDDPSQASPHRDDASILSLLYPAPGVDAATGTIRGTILDSDLETPLDGVNVTARNAADPYDDAVASISGAFSYFHDAPPAVSGDYFLGGLTPGAGYTVAIGRIDRGSFSQPVTSPLPGPDELYNGAGESNDPDRDLPSESIAVVPPAGGAAEGIDIVINAPAGVRILADPSALAPPDDAQVSGFAVPGEIDIRRVEARFRDTDGDGSQETLGVDLDVVGPLGAKGTEFRFQMDFGEPRKVGRLLLSLADQTVEPGTGGVPTADLALRVSFDARGPHFAGLPGLASQSSVDHAAGRIHFVASVEEILAEATPDQIEAAQDLGGSYTLLGFASAQAGKMTDRAPDTNDNDVPTIVRETLRLTFTPSVPAPAR